MNKQHTHGFTLLELMVALSLFALIGIGGHALLQSVIKGREISADHTLRLSALQKAVWIMSRDIVQIESPSAATAKGDYAITFVRHGWSNPLLQSRSDRLAIAYKLEDHKLIRYYWPAEQAESPPRTQLLLEGVSNFSIKPLPPRVVEITLDVQPYGMVRRVIEVPEP